MRDPLVRVVAHRSPDRHGRLMRRARVTAFRAEPTPQATWERMMVVLRPAFRNRARTTPFDSDPVAAAAALEAALAACGSPWADRGDQIDLTWFLLRRTVLSAPRSVWARTMAHYAVCFLAGAASQWRPGAVGADRPVIDRGMVSGSDRAALEAHDLLRSWWRARRVGAAPDDLVPLLASPLAGLRDWALSCVATLGQAAPRGEPPEPPPDVVRERGP